MKRKIYVLLFCIIFLLSAVSADFEFDNVKDYDPITREVTITNAFGFGDVIGKARLDSPLHVIINKVGYTNVANITVWAYQDYTEAFKSLQLYNKSEEDWINHPIDRTIDVKYLTYKQTKVDDYEEVIIGTYPNGTTQYGIQKVGSHFIQEEVWEDLNPVDLMKNEHLTIGLFTNVKEGDYIEWIPTIYGIEIEEWSDWIVELNSNLVTYYNMDQLSGPIIDLNRQFNGTNVGATYGATGILNLSLDFESSSSDYMSAGGGMVGNTGGVAFSAWIKPESLGADDFTSTLFNARSTPSFPNDGVVIVRGGSTGWSAAVRTTDGTVFASSSMGWAVGEWQHILVTYNGSAIGLYQNGTSVGAAAQTGNVLETNLTTYIAKRNTDRFYDGLIDEVAIYNDGLDATQIAALWGNGIPPAYNETAISIPVITFNSPNSTNYTTSPQTIQFNFTASDGINLTDVKLYVNGVLNQTNASGINNTDYLFNITVGDGTYTVFGRATNNNSETTDTETRTFIIDSTAPIVNITSPSDPYTVTQFNESVQINWTVLDDNPDTCWYVFPVPQCYQESVDVSNQTGIDGVCNQNYNGTVSLNVPGDFYIYENYEKPSSDIAGAVWKVKHGALDTYNVTIPDSCFSYNSTHLNLRIRAIEAISSIATSFGQCYNGSWQTITETSTGGGSFCATSGAALSRMNDGDYDTGFMYSNLLFSGTTGCGRQGTWYDDAIFWEDVSTPTEIISCDLNTTTINYPTSNPDSETFYLFANDSFGSEGNDSLLLVKSTDSPNITIDSPITLYDTLQNGQSIDLNFSFENNTVLDSCWYNYNNINTTINCTENTSFSYVFRNDNVTLYVNDTLGNMNQSTKSFSAKIYYREFVYENETVEGSLEDYYVNITLGDAYSFDNATLYYDGVGTAANSLISSGQNNYIGVVNLEVPNVDNSTSLSFLWNIGLTDGSSINSSLLNQTVNPLNIDNCSTYNFTILNISLFTERDKLPLNGTIEVYLNLLNVPSYNTIGNVTGLFENVQNVAVCSENNLSTSSVAYSAEIRYYSTDFATELYNIQRRTVQPIADEVELYDLNSTFSTEFKVTYQDSTFTFVPGAIVQLQRKYVSEGIYRTVEAPITSSEGFTVVHIDLDSVPYRATVVKNGVVLDEFENLVFKCQSELTGECEYKLLGAIDPDNIQDYDNQTDFSYSEPVLANGTVTVSFTVPTGVPSIINVVLEQKDQFGNTTLCNRTVTTSGGSVSCNYSETLGDSYIDFYISKDGVPVAVKSYVVVSESDLDWLDNNFIFILVLLFSLVGLALTSPEWIVINGIVSMIIAGGLFMANGLNFVTGLGSLAWLVIAAVIIISKMSKQEDR